MEPASPPIRATDAPKRRDPALDLLRTVALGRVLLWHAFAAPWMTFFAAMPLMFFVAGTLLEASARGGYAALVRRRARRLLLPLWVYGGVVAVAAALRDPPGADFLDQAAATLAHVASWIVPLVDPAGSEWHGGWLSTHLWYLRAYLWVLLLVPLLGLLAGRLGRTLPVLAVAVGALELADRADVPVIGAGTTGVLLGDIVTYGGFVVLGMAYRRHGGVRLPARALGAAAVVAGAAIAAYIAAVGLPDGGVNDSYVAVALTGAAWLLAAGAAEAPIRRLAERQSIRRVTGMVTRRAVTLYLWHPAAIVLAYAVVDGWDRFPKTSLVHHGPTPAVLVVALALASTAVAAAALGWVEDLAARRSPVGHARRHTGGHRFGLRVVPLAAVVPTAATAMAFVVPALVVPVADDDPAGASTFLAVRPPSSRAPLGNEAFGRQMPLGRAVPAGPVDPHRAPLQSALDRWLGGRSEFDSVAVGVGIHGRVWTGTAHHGDGARLKEGGEFAALSMTKTFTTVLVLDQVRAGRLVLDAPFPPVAGIRLDSRAAQITVRQLLQHTSGLVDYAAAPGFDPSRPLTPTEAVQLAADAGLRSVPGTELQYANTNFQLLGLIVEQAAGRPYGELLDELFRTHGLRRSSLGPGGPGWPGFSSGGVMSTLEDLTRWGHELFTPGRVLPAGEVQLLTTPDHKNMALSMWPLCPCGMGPDGSKQYGAVGQTVGYGGLVRLPSGMTMVVRFEPAPSNLDESIVDLGRHLEAALWPQRAVDP